jgi:predicted enzyme related to lactoylglutathione lyase
MSDARSFIWYELMTTGPSEVPGGGWIIHATDPQSAMFPIVGPRMS